MISNEIEYHAPETIDAALALLDDPARDVELLAGGMSLVPVMTLGLAAPEALVSLKRLGELSSIQVTDTDVRIGGTTTHSEVADSPEVRAALPVLATCASMIGDVQVRNRGTIGGSLAHADPAANYPPLALALGASMVIRSTAGERVIRADDFFEGLMQTAVGEGDILVEVRFPRPVSGSGAAYCEFVRVEGNFALVNASAIVAPDGTDGTLALGGVGSVPQKVGLAQALGSGGVDVAALDAAVDERTAGVFPDINGSVDYKRALARTFARRAVDEALAARSEG